MYSVQRFALDLRDPSGKQAMSAGAGLSRQAWSAETSASLSRLLTWHCNTVSAVAQRTAPHLRAAAVVRAGAAVSPGEAAGQPRQVGHERRRHEDRTRHSGALCTNLSLMSGGPKARNRIIRAGIQMSTQSLLVSAFTS